VKIGGIENVDLFGMKGGSRKRKWGTYKSFDHKATTYSLKHSKLFF
jgi:hypothetical protein